MIRIKHNDKIGFHFKFKMNGVEYTHSHFHFRWQAEVSKKIVKQSLKQLL